MQSNFNLTTCSLVHVKKHIWLQQRADPSLTFVMWNFDFFDNAASSQPVSLRVDPVISRIHPDEPVGSFSVNWDDAAARLHRRLRRWALSRYLVGLGRCGRARSGFATHRVFRPLGLPENFRSMTVVKTLKTAAFYELTEIISQVRWVKCYRNITNCKIHRSVGLGLRHDCFVPWTRNVIGTSTFKCGVISASGDVT